MAATITAVRTADAGAPQVGVTLAGLSTVTATSVVVEQSWDAGATWNGVRGGVLSAVLGSAFVRDFVCPLNISTIYRARWVSGPLFYSRLNRATNPSVEVDASGWSGWSGSGGTATFARAAGGYRGGDGCAGSWTVAPTTGGGVLYDTGTTLAAGTQYTFSMYVWSSVAVAVAPQIQWYNGSTATTSGGGSPVAVPGHAWTRVSMTATSGSADNHAQFRAYVSGSGLTVGAIFTGDALLIETGAVLGTYFDGDTASDGRYSYTWNGTAGSSTSNEYTNEVWSSPVTVDSAQAWIQDPLNPTAACPLYADMSSGHILLTLASFATSTWAQHVDAAVPIGASLPVASISVRQRVAATPMVLMYDVAAEGGALRSLLLSSGQLVVRGLPVTGLLDPVAHVAVGDATEMRLSSGQVSQWTLTVRQTRPTTLRIVVPWWTYDQVKALIQSQLGATATFDQVKAAQPAGKTYTQWLANPGVAS